jgi:hypothetical protein
VASSRLIVARDGSRAREGEQHGAPQEPEDRVREDRGDHRLAIRRVSPEARRGKRQVRGAPRRDRHVMASRAHRGGYRHARRQDNGAAVIGRPSSATVDHAPYAS